MAAMNLVPACRRDERYACRSAWAQIDFAFANVARNDAGRAEELLRREIVTLGAAVDEIERHRLAGGEHHRVRVIAVAVKRDALHRRGHWLSGGGSDAEQYGSD